jgi:hypothetical protein
VSEPLENLYFNWLCAKVMHVENSTPSLTYWNLLRTLHNTEFVWLIVGDDNRAEDGLELRGQFLIAADIPDHPEWRHEPCGLLEMLIAFSRRAEFQTDRPASEWFWEFIENLGLLDCNDAANCNQDDIGEVLYQLVWRTYDMYGQGGLFPIEHPKHDQTKTEIWYQFCEYLVDQHRLL